jgi:Domain of unknown function (DUF4399)
VYSVTLAVIRTLALLAVLLLSGLGARADDHHPWLSSPLRVEQPATYFTNLADGASIETPYVLKFGLSRYGLSPIDKPVPHTGHHHLLVNRDLPLDFSKPLPFNDQYIHFGKGQMETVLNFPPGTYTLRLLLADDKHIPYFIYSKPITITVTRRYDGLDPASMVKRGVALLAPNAGDTVHPPFRVMFHASGMNVGNAEIKTAGTGHFRLVAERAGARPELVDFGSGATEAWLNPPVGDYSFHVEMVSNADGAVSASSPPIDIKVRASASE